jgi:hypothetical protein
MTKRLLIVAVTVLAPAVISAQTVPEASSFQQQGWMRFPNTSVTVIHSNPMDGQSGPVLARPVSASEALTTVQTLSDGSHIKSSETNSFYRDARGRMRIETETGIMIYDPEAGVTYDLTKRNHTYAKHLNSKDSTVTIAAAAHFSSVSSGAAKAGGSRTGGPVVEDLAPQMINGVFAKGSRVTTTIPAGAIGNDRELKVVSERWFSDDLKLLVKSWNSDPRFGVSTYELTNIVQGDPDAALFRLPSDYVVEGDHTGPTKHN